LRIVAEGSLEMVDDKEIGEDAPVAEDVALLVGGKDRSREVIHTRRYRLAIGTRKGTALWLLSDAR
jgi:hypothetical protein